MRAAVGDWLRLNGRTAGSPQRTGQIIEIRGTNGEPPYLVRFSDGRTSLVIPGPGSDIAPSGPVQHRRLPAGRGGAAMSGLTFRITASQRRALAITAAIPTALAAGLAGVAAAAQRPGRLMALAASFGILALIVLYYAVAYAAACTRCTPAGLRVRGVAGPRYVPWARLREIAVRDYGSDPYRRGMAPYRLGTSGGLRIVTVTADNGRRLWLGAPIDGGQGLDDPEFDSKVRQIEDFWHSATSRSASPAGRAPADHDPAGSRRTDMTGSGLRTAAVPAGFRLTLGIWRVSRAGLVIVALLIAVVGLPVTLARDAAPAWSAYLGHGRHGTFTATAKSCPTGCLWYGDFTAGNGAVGNHVLLADGGTVTKKGDAVRAVDVGRHGMVYPASGAKVLYPVIWLLLLEISAAAYVLALLIRKLRRRRTRGRPGRRATGSPA